VIVDCFLLTTLTNNKDNVKLKHKEKCSINTRKKEACKDTKSRGARFFSD